jgi:hypothetical protein
MRQPVTITQRTKPRLVLMSVEEYETLPKYADHRQAFTIENMPDELFEAFQQAVEDYANSPEV